MRRRLALVLALAAGAGCTPSPPSPPVATPAPDPYGDLAPVGRAIGDARVVALGEPSHAEGNMFAAQARLVAYLHDRLGFTVLAWEAGLWSCETDAAHCLGFPWGGVVETRDVRPPPAGIHVTGFDFQFSGPEREKSLALLHAKLDAVVAPNPALASRLAVAFGRFPKMRLFHPLTADERAGDREAFREVLSALAAQPAGVEDLPLLQRAVANVIGLYDWHEAVHAETSTTIDWGHNALNNVRDRAMAENLLWLRNVRYPGQKIVLWLASFHAARSLAILSEPPGGKDPADRSGFVPMGEWLSNALGAGYFALGMTAYDGEIGNLPQQKVSAVGAAPAGSIEQIWLPSEGAFRFVARSALGDTPTVGRFIGLHPFIGQWDRVFDGGIVFRRVTPATAE